MYVNPQLYKSSIVMEEGEKDERSGVDLGMAGGANIEEDLEGEEEEEEEETIEEGRREEGMGLLITPRVMERISFVVNLVSCLLRWKFKNAV